MPPFTISNQMLVLVAEIAEKTRSVSKDQPKGKESVMQTIRKLVFLALAVSLCLVAAAFANAEAAGEIRIPATAMEALAQLPIEVPPIPRVTVAASDPEMTVFQIDGLEKWSLKGDQQYQNGAFLFNPHAEAGPYLPIEGRENEPFSVAVTQQIQQLQGCTFSFYLEEGRLKFRYGEDEHEWQLSFEQASCDFEQSGRLKRYTFLGKDGLYVTANYSADGLLNSYIYRYDDGSKVVDYDALGMVMDVYGLQKDGVTYSCIYDQWRIWNGNGYTSCEKPEDIEIPAPAVLYPEESIAQIKAKREAFQASLPALPPQEGVFSQRLDVASQFPPIPVMTQEELEDGSLRYILTGLEPWGIDMSKDYRYSGNSDSPFAIYAAAVPGQITLTIPAEVISAWNESFVWMLSSDVVPTSASVGEYPCVRYYDWLDAWVFIVYVGPNAKYEIVLGSTPYVMECLYTLDGREYYASYRSDGVLGYEEISSRFSLDGNEVECVYTQQGTVDCYRLYAFVDGVSLSIEYDMDGQLTELYYYGNQEYYYQAAANQWYHYVGNQEEACEMAENFDLSPWLMLDLDRLESV